MFPFFQSHGLRLIALTFQIWRVAWQWHQPIPSGLWDASCQVQNHPRAVVFWGHELSFSCWRGLHCQHNSPCLPTQKKLLSDINKALQSMDLSQAVGKANSFDPEFTLCWPSIYSFEPSALIFLINLLGMCCMDVTHCTWTSASKWTVYMNHRWIGSCDLVTNSLGVLQCSTMCHTLQPPSWATTGFQQHEISVEGHCQAFIAHLLTNRICPDFS